VLEWHDKYVQGYSHPNVDPSAPLFDSEGSETDSDGEGDAEEGLMYMKKVLVTPLRVLPYPPTLEPSCRILRQCGPVALVCYAMLKTSMLK
jgi:hypothetical protein